MNHIGLELAQLHSDAVDYPKSGVKARMTKKQRIPAWPHFFNKPVDEGVYHSTKILGLLYDMVEMVDFTPSYEFPPNQTLMTMFTLTSAEIEEARELKADYDAVIRRIMAQHDISTEFEVWSTFVMSHGGSNDYKFHEEIGDISFALKERFRKQVMDSCTDKATELPRKVVAMYVVTAQEIEQAKIDLRKERERLAPRSKGKQTPAFVKEDVSKLPLMSFPWVFPDLLVAISHGNTSVAQDYSGPGHADVHEDVEDDEDLEEVSVDGE